MIIAALVALIALLIAGGLAVWQPWSAKVETASVERMALPLPNKPSIAVLPFKNLGNDPKQEVFSDGLSKDIITDLSAFADLMVIASTSSFSYKGKPVKVQQVAEDLGVRFVLDGSIQTAGDNARINVQLVDALSGEQLWAERYDRKMQDIFAVQDEITQKVVAMLGAMEGPVANSDRAKARLKQHVNLNAYEFVLLAQTERSKFYKEGNEKSFELLQKAIALDPQYARAHVELAWTYFQDITRYRSRPPGTLSRRRSPTPIEQSSWMNPLLKAIGSWAT